RTGEYCATSDLSGLPGEHAIALVGALHAGDVIDCLESARKEAGKRRSLWILRGPRKPERCTTTTWIRRFGTTLNFGTTASSLRPITSRAPRGCSKSSRNCS